MKNIIRCLFGLPVVLSVPEPPQPLTAPGPPQLPIDILLTGLASKDKCYGEYSYCPSLDNCIKYPQTYCQEFDFPYDVLYHGSGIILPPKKIK